MRFESRKWVIMRFRPPLAIQGDYSASSDPWLDLGIKWVRNGRKRNSCQRCIFVCLERQRWTCCVWGWPPSRNFGHCLGVVETVSRLVGWCQTLISCSSQSRVDNRLLVSIFAQFRCYGDACKRTDRKKRLHANVFRCCLTAWILLIQSTDALLQIKLAQFCWHLFFIDADLYKSLWGELPSTYLSLYLALLPFSLSFISLSRFFPFLL